MLMTRCGIDAAEYFEREDFGAVVNFNTPQTLNAIGIATSDIAEMALREISLSMGIRHIKIIFEGVPASFRVKHGDALAVLVYPTLKQPVPHLYGGNGNCIGALGAQRLY